MSKQKAKIYFTKIILSEKIVEMFKILNKSLEGRVAVKAYSDEKGNQNFLHPDFYVQLLIMSREQ